MIVYLLQCRTANSATVETMRTNCCCVMVVTRDTTLTALNRRWKTFQMETGKKLVVSSLYFLSRGYCGLV